MSEVTKQVWLVKYCLKGGITRHAVVGGIDKKYIRVEDHCAYYVLGRDCFVARADAVAAAEQMRTKRLASLRKSIRKLEKMQFGEGE